MIRAYHTLDPNSKFKMTPFSPPPFINIPDEPKELNKLVFAPKNSLLNPMKNNWNIRDMVNMTP